DPLSLPRLEEIAPRSEELLVRRDEETPAGLDPLEREDPVRTGRRATGRVPAEGGLLLGEPAHRRAGDGSSREFLEDSAAAPALAAKADLEVAAGAPGLQLGLDLLRSEADGLEPQPEPRGVEIPQLEGPVLVLEGARRDFPTEDRPVLRGPEPFDHDREGPDGLPGAGFADDPRDPRGPGEDDLEGAAAGLDVVDGRRAVLGVERVDREEAFSEAARPEGPVGGGLRERLRRPHGFPSLLLPGRRVVELH